MDGQVQNGTYLEATTGIDRRHRRPWAIGYEPLLASFVAARAFVNTFTRATCVTRAFDITNAHATFAGNC